MLSQNFLPADQLGLTEKQRDAMIMFLGMCERGEIAFKPEYPDRGPGKGIHTFNLGTWWHDFGAWSDDPKSCGTVGCIGGWIDFLCGVGNRYHKNSIDSIADRNVALHNLFYPPTECAAAWGDITLDQAIQATRSYLTTGQAKWEEILS